MLNWVRGRPREVIRRMTPAPVRAAVHGSLARQTANGHGGGISILQMAGDVTRAFRSDTTEIHRLIDEAMIALADKKVDVADLVLSSAEAKMPQRRENATNYIFETYYQIDKGQPLDPRDVASTRLEHARILVDSAKAQMVGVYSDNVAFWTMYDGYIRDQRAISLKKITPYGYHSHSVSNDDGMIAEIFRRIGTTNRYFVEFGINSGEQTNTTALLYQGWRGLWIEAASCYHVMAQHLFRDFIADGKLNTTCRFICAENINEIISTNLHPDVGPEIDLLSIDVDGNDYWIWNAIDCVKPRVLVIEYNSYFHPPESKVQAYDPVRVYNGTFYYGASLEAVNRLCERKGYKLVGCSFVGDNAFFVRSDLVGDKFYEPGNAEAHFEPQRAVSFPVGHRPGVGPWQFVE